ncbi:MAG: NAD(P)H-dependent oxidoreductase subunit E [Deltaproteobacteria bacterium]|nr:NAD(P)H-dependent oxidoreductase subunit E [Deltaproteobacteria bacterium]
MNVERAGGRDLGAILARHDYDPSNLLQILREVQPIEGFVSKTAITQIAEALQISRGWVEGVVGFYSFLSEEPTGRYRVLFSDNITDELAGAHELRQRMLDAFKLELGQVSRDGLVSIDRTSCTGMCDQGPAMLVNGRAVARLTPARIGAVSSLIRGGSPVEEWPANLLEINSNILRKDLLLSAAYQPGEPIARVIARGRSAALEEIQRSNLRGRGGAGFGTGAKWEACARADGPARYVVCNADEGEPGTFKDRELLTRYPGQVIEGMTVAAFAIQASHGFIYLRGEYSHLIEPLRTCIEERRRDGLLGRGIAGLRGFDFDVRLHVGQGAYVCGEESALLESLEGKRGIPRNRPPYPVTHGYLGAPTIVNNVETFVAAAHISVHGGDWFRAVGTPSSAGTKLLSVSGDVAHPGTYEVPFGVSVRQVLEDAGARDTEAVQVGGPSGVLLARHELDRKIAFEDVSTAGAFMVFDKSRDILQVIDNFARFFAHESCGFCTPCRVGTTMNRELMRRIVSGHGCRRDVKDLARVARLMKATSHCGLGITAANPITDGLTKFKPAFDRRLPSMEVRAVFDLDASLAPAREATGRDDLGAHLTEEGP